ncbi:SHQ1 protein-domain-containing protein [Infundibulicybe gibba]|nr:SHQ1 protein-domain-containing protein [Infundibulicybe gibba]
MITPRFTCSQTPESVIVSMYCPSIRAADIEIHVDKTLFTVHVNPYFLRLNFSNALVEDDSSSAKYDPSSGYLTVTLTKEVHGQIFEDLDLLAKLLAPRPKAAPPVIEVMESTTEPITDLDELVNKTSTLSLEQETILQAADNDWQLPQNVPEELPPLDTSVERRYGFLDMHSGYFRHVTHTENEVNELGAQAETCTVQERRQLRIEHENQKWDPEYYMADFADDDYIQELIGWENPYNSSDEPIVYTEEETIQIMRLPRKEYIPTSFQTHQLYLTLLTLLFSYAYDTRTTQHDPTPESAWTLCNLTPAFSALDPLGHLHRDQITVPLTFTDAELSETLASSYRRSLAFPLHRSFALSEACREDVASILVKGNRAVCRCLLEMKRILDHHEVYYIYSKIWVDDFCVWIQANASNDVLQRVGRQLAEFRMEKKLIGWELEQFEAATAAAANRELDSDDESDSDDSS